MILKGTRTGQETKRWYQWNVCWALTIDVRGTGRSGVGRVSPARESRKAVSMDCRHVSIDYKPLM